MMDPFAICRSVLLLLSLSGGLLPVAALAGDVRTREMERLLWALGYGADTIDGSGGKAFRERVTKFLADEKETAKDDDDALRRLKAAEERRHAAALAPFERPRLVERPNVRTSYSDRVLVADELDMILVGSCQKLARYRLSEGKPATYLEPRLNENKPTYLPALKAIGCLSKWDDGDRQGLIIVDAQTGHLRDAIVLPAGKVFLSEVRCTRGCETLIVETQHYQGVKYRLWRVNPQTRSVEQLRVSDEKFELLAVTPDGVYVFDRNSTTDQYRVTDLASRKVVFTNKINYGNVIVSSDGSRHIIQKYNDYLTYELRETGTGRLIGSIKQPNDASFNLSSHLVAFAPDGNSVTFLNESEQTLTLWSWDFRKGTVNRVSAAMTYRGSEAFYDAANNRVLALGSAGLSVFEAPTGRPLVGSSSTGAERWAPTAAAFSAGGQIAAVVGPKRFSIANLASGQVTFHAVIELENPTAAAFVGSDQLVIGTESGEVVAFSVSSGHRLHSFPKQEGSIRQLVPAQNRPYLAVQTRLCCSPSRTTTAVFDTGTRNQIYTYRTSNTHEVGLGFADSERRLIFGDGFNAVVADIASGAVVLKRDLQTNVSRVGTRTTWYHAWVGWVLPQQPNASGILFAANSTAGAAVIYRYNAGSLSIEKGSINLPGATDYRSARYSDAAMLDDGSLAGKLGNEVKVANLVSDTITGLGLVHGRSLGMAALGGGRFTIVDDTGELRIYDRRSAEPLVTILFHDGNEWASLAGRGFFGGTRAAAESLFLATKGDETIPIDSLFDTLFRPDLVAAAAIGDPAGLIKEAERKTDLGALLKEGMPPRVAILAPPESRADSETLNVRAALTPGIGGIGRIEWRVNGIVRVARAPASPSPPSGTAIEIEDPLLLEAGENIVELTVYNATNRIASSPVRVKVNWDAPPQAVAPRLFVLSIGVDDYWDSRLRLNFAASDARAIARSLERAGKDHYRSTHTWVLTDRDVVRTRIEATFDEIARSIRSSDVFVLFVAGHGKTEEGRYYFLPQDLRYTGEASLTEQGIGQSDWQGWLTRVATRRSLMLFDTCESGTLTLDKVTRGFGRVAALDRLTRATGRSVLAASSDDGPALEGFQGHGVFAYTILEALSTADPRFPGLVQVTSLAAHVGQRVPDLSFGKFGIRQVPQMKLTGEDFAIGKVIPAVAAADDQFIPPQPTHVVVRATELLDPDGKPARGEQLTPGTLVRVLGGDGELATVARNGRKIGTLRSTDVAPMQ